MNQATTARPIQPVQPGPAFMNGKPVLVTRAGVCIGLLYQPPKHQDVGEGMSRLQAWLLSLNRSACK
jgi:hypothetical protein